MCRITTLRYACTHKVDTTDEECAIKHQFPTDAHFVSKLDRFKSTDCPNCQAAKTSDEIAAKKREAFRKSVQLEAEKAREETRKRAEEAAQAREKELKVKEAMAIFYSVTSALEGGPTFTQSKCIFECCYENEKPRVKTPKISVIGKVPDDFAQTKTEVVPIPGLLRVNVACA